MSALLFTLVSVGEGQWCEAGGGGHVTDDIKGDLCDFFLYFSYLNSLAVQLSS